MLIALARVAKDASFTVLETAEKIAMKSDTFNNVTDSQRKNCKKK